MRRALDIFTASLGPNHPSTKTVANNYRLLLEEIETAKAQRVVIPERRRRYPGS